MSKAWDKGSTRAWRTTRARVLLRDGYRCRVRLPSVCTGAAPLRGGHVHHLHGKANCPGCAADYPSHLVAACRSCNLKLGNPESQGDPPNRGVTQW